MKYRSMFAASMLLLTLAVGRASALDFVVYKASKATQKTAAGESALKPGEKLSPAATVTISYGGQLQIINQDSQERHTLKTPGSGKLSSMLRDSRNSVSKVTRQYFEYMMAQVMSGGKSVQVRHADFATVTREMQKTVRTSNEALGGLDDEFEQFKLDVEKEFASFQEEVNREYANFIKGGWLECSDSAGKPRPKDEHVAPVVTQSTSPTATNSFFRRSRKVVKAKPEVPQPVPIAAIPEQEAPDEQEVHTKVWGTDFVVRFDTKKGRFHLKDVSNEAVAEGWMKLSDKRYNNLIRDCMDIRFERHLGDWAYLQVLKGISESCMGKGNEATLLMAYLFCQSGYQMRLSREGDRLYMLYGSEHYIYDKNYFKIDSLYFYPFDFDARSISVCAVPYPGEQAISLYMTEPQRLDFDPTAMRTVTCERYPDIKLTYNVNQHLIEFYNNYPTSVVDDDLMTRWTMYANTPLEEEVKEQLYPVLRKKLDGLSQVEAVNRLLNWIQTGFEYKYDDEVWGHDRAFFSEETLIYPYCDCEDRAILLSRLVRDLVGLKCILVYYPGHLAMAAHFDENPTGTYYILNDERYYVCDPTIIGWGAPVGECMEQFKDCTDVGLILLDNPS